MLAIQLPSHDERVERIVDDELTAERGHRPQTLTMRWSVDDGTLIARWTITP
jgi:hypothetical protein